VLDAEARAVHSIVGSSAHIDEGAAVLDLSIMGNGSHVSGGRTVVGARLTMAT
jgi:hypothetical protein